MVFPITKEVVNRISSVINWHREALKNNNKGILQVPIKDNWKSWDDNRLWCSLFFSITSPGSSKNAHEYLRKIENGMQDFELKPELLSSLSDGERIKAIWTFGTGKNAIKSILEDFSANLKTLGIEEIWNIG
ncbi:MAG: hypothetical protein KAR45_07100 [Desulfobacteraceae bacterium]|nr:hypothetical protein [Desulfobacteraceae bacterium]